MNRHKRYLSVFVALFAATLACTYLGSPPIDPGSVQPTWEAQTCPAVITARSATVRLEVPGWVEAFDLPRDQDYMLVENALLTLERPGRADVNYGGGQKLTLYAPEEGSADMRIEKWNGVLQPAIYAGAGRVVESGENCLVEVLAGGNAVLRPVGSEYIVIVQGVGTDSEEVQIAVFNGAIEVNDLTGEYLAGIVEGEALMLVNGVPGETFLLPASAEELLQNLEAGRDLFGEPVRGAGADAPQATLIPTATAEQPTATAPATILPPTQSPPFTPTVAPGRVADIILWHTWEDGRAKGLEVAAQDFANNFRALKVEVVFIPPNELEKRLKTAIAAGEPPTLVLAGAGAGVRFYNLGWIADVSFEGEPEMEIIDLRARNSVSYDVPFFGSMMVGAPVSFDGVVLYRNTKIIPETYEEFDKMISVAAEMTEKNEGALFGSVLDLGPYFTAGHLYGFGGRLMDEKGDPVFADEDGKAWLALLSRFASGGFATFNETKDEDYFKEGLAGYIVSSTSNMYELADAIGYENLAIDPWPKTELGQLSGFIQTEALLLSKGLSEDEQAAGLALMRYLMSIEGQTTLRDYGVIPVNFEIGIFDPLMQQAEVAFASNTMLPNLPQLDYYWEPLAAAILDSVTGDPKLRISYEDALKFAYIAIYDTLHP